MFKIKLCLYTSKTPCEIKIFSGNGNLIYETIMLENNKTCCLCVNSNYVLIYAQSKNQTIKKYVDLIKCNCYSSTAWLVFKPNFSRQTITLVDAFYGIPIKNAVLNFSN